MNLYDAPVPHGGSERIDILVQQQGVRIERIASNRAESGWFDQEEDEWVVLVEGEAALQVEEETFVLRRGDTLLLRAHVRHRVVSTSEDALWLAVFVAPETKRV